MRMYHQAELEKAAARFNTATGLDYDDFTDWLGFSTPISVECRMQLPIYAGENTQCCIKMDFLLSDNWHAMIKAYIAKHGPIGSVAKLL